MRATVYDARTATRAAMATLLVLAIACLVTAATDEGGLSWGVRAGRVLPLTPVGAALGAWLSLVQPRARGELLALAALGRSTAQSTTAAALGACLVAWCCAGLVLADRAVDLGGFFPTAPRAAEFAPAGGGFVDLAGALRIEPNGEIVALAPSNQALAPSDQALAPSDQALATGSGQGSRSGSAALPAAIEGEAYRPLGVPRGGRGAAALAMVLAGLAFPLVAARLQIAAAGRRRTAQLLWGLSSLAATLAASTVLFAAASSGRVPPFYVGAPAIVLLAAAVFRYRADAWPTRAE